MRYWFFGILLCCALPVFAQQFTVRGVVQDTDGRPVEFAMVTIESTETTDIFEEFFTESNGNFRFEVAPGDYTLIIQPPTGGLISRDVSVTQDVNLGTITVESAIQLGAVVAQAEQPLYRIELDKRVYDMSRDVTVRGATVSDALNNVPSVQVDGDGSISLRGNESVRIFIDGRPSAMTGISNPAEALRNLPADMVERVEVITNPSARYDAQGSGGIINIVMKKGQASGLNGSVTTFVGYPFSLGAAANLNWRLEKWNFFINPSVNNRRMEGRSSFINTFFGDEGPDRVETQDGKTYRERFTTMLSGGFQHYLSEKNTIGLNASYRYRAGNGLRELVYNNYLGDERYAASNRDQREDEHEHSLEATASFRREFNKDGHELNIIASASKATEDDNANIMEYTTLGTRPNQYDRTIIAEQQTRQLIQADYVLPHGESARFELGYKGEWEHFINDFTLLRRQAGSWMEHPNFTDVVNYYQYVQAAYTQYGNKHGNFSYLLGFRVENSDIRIQSENAYQGLGSDNQKNYTNFFPSATLNYAFDEDGRNAIQVSYSKRIRRPHSRFLNPFSNFSDDRNTFVGNPDLDPSFTDAYELAYITQIGRITVTPSVYYQITRDDINVFRRQSTFQGNNIFIAQPINAGTMERWGGEFVFSAPIQRWWRLFGNANIFAFKQDAVYDDPISGQQYDLSGEGVTWFARLSNNFSLDNNWEIQLNGFYRGPQANAQTLRKAIMGLDFGISKDLFNRDATLSFNVRDIFNTRRRRAENYGADWISQMDSQWNVRTFTLTFSYRINQQKQRERRGRGDGGDDMGDGGGDF
ncbi:MAG: TonB-dependent receptor [Weeksellaceae bacterium]|nr:TonB-dependent receptor [Weeksellaceae bacterium]